MKYVNKETMKDKIKVVIYGDHPGGRTAFGRLIKHVAETLHRDDRFEVAVLGIGYGDVFNTNYFQNITPYPTYELATTKNDQQAVIAALTFLNKCHCDIFLTVNDIWHLWNVPSFLLQLEQQGRRPLWAPWFPVDQPIREDWKPLIKFCDIPTVMSQYGLDQCKSLGFSAEFNRAYIDTNVYKQLSPRIKTEERIKFCKNVGIPVNSFIFGFVGKNQLRKNIHDLMKAFKKFKEEYPLAELYLHTESTGWGGDILQYAGELGFKPILKGLQERRNDERMNVLYNIMDCLIVPSLAGGIELPIYEAQLAGIPVIGADNTSIAEALSNDCGVLVEKGKEIRKVGIMNNGQPDEIKLNTFDQKSMLTAMENIYTNKSYRDKITGKGYDSARKYQAQIPNWADYLAQQIKVCRGKEQIKKDKLKSRNTWIRDSKELIANGRNYLDLLTFLPTYNLQCGIAQYGKELLDAVQNSKLPLTLRTDVYPNGELDGLEHYLKFKNPKVLHVHHEFSFIRDVNKFATILGNFKGKKVVTMHTLWKDMREFQSIANNVDHVIVHSEAWLDSVANSVFIPMPCSNHTFDESEIKELRAKMGINESTLVIGSSGFIRRQKGYDNLIRAAKILIAQGIDTKVLLLAPQHFAGWSFEDLLFEIIEEDNMEKNVMILRGYNKKEDSMKLLSCADMIIYPYTNDEMAGAGCSASIKDALSLKRPMLISDCSSFTDMGREVYRMENNSPHGIARSIQWVMDNDRIKQQLIKKSSEKAERNNIDNIAKKYVELFGF